MNVSNPYSQYQNTSVMTATPEKLLIMLYDGAIKFLGLSKVAIEEKQIESAHKNLVKAQNILVELMSTLNMDYPISEYLFSLYEYFNRRLTYANFHKDVEAVEEVLGLMKELRETWSQAMNSINKRTNVGLDNAI